MSALDPPIVMVRGDQWVLPFKWQDLEGDDVSLVNVEISAQISWLRRSLALTLANERVVITDDAEGEGEFRVEEVDNVGIPLGKLSYLTVWAQFASGNRQTLCRVPFRVELGPDASVVATGSDPELITTTAAQQQLVIVADPLEVPASDSAGEPIGLLLTLTKAA